jgi:hypothetical protein
MAWGGTGRRLVDVLRTQAFKRSLESTPAVYTRSTGSADLVPGNHDGHDREQTLRPRRIYDRAYGTGGSSTMACAACTIFVLYVLSFGLDTILFW